MRHGAIDIFRRDLSLQSRITRSEDIVAREGEMMIARRDIADSLNNK